MNVLFVASECYPLIKTGGLADVVGALPFALGAEGFDTRVLMPCYRGLASLIVNPTIVHRYSSLAGGPAEVLQGTTATGLGVFLLDAPHLFDRAGGPYLGPDGLDWPDNDVRFAALSRVGADIGTGLLSDWHVDIVHVHDWQAGPTLAFLHQAGARVASVLTIHNLAFQGVFGADRREPLGFSAESFSVEGIEYWGSLSFLKAAIVYADSITTVSPTYAQEILGPADGFGMDGILSSRRSLLSGILNGIDTSVWDPATDPCLPHHYSAKKPNPKQQDKTALQAELGLERRSDIPLFGVVSRLSDQKGIDLILDALPTILAGGQLAILGSGDPVIESALHVAAQNYPDRLAFVRGYDEDLAHRIQAGSDVIMVPSRFEPCGLTQLCGLRYGTLPLVSRVGGLADTVIDANAAALADDVATGFVFAPLSADALSRTIERVYSLWSDQRRWQKVRRRAMTRDVSWAGPAASYAALYERLLTE